MPRPRPPLPTPEAAIANLRHGINSRSLAVPGLEDHADWIRHRDKIIESLQPEGELELELATSIAEYAWRRRRVARHETHMIAVERGRDILKEGRQEYKKRALDEAASECPPQETESRHVTTPAYADMLINGQIDNTIKAERMLPAPKDLDRIIRYEQHLTRQAIHALHELQALQARRKRDPAPLARLSVVGFSTA